MSDLHEQSVRTYLAFLDDPSSLRDQKAIDAARSAADKASDPIEKLKALSQVQALEAVDGSEARAAFVEHAKSWAEANGVTAEAFAELGVPAADLRDAGLTGGRTRAASAPKGRRSRVSPDAVRAAVPSGQFTIAELQDASGASTATVRKVIAEMEDAGQLKNLGPDQNHSGRGRAPLLFTKA